MATEGVKGYVGKALDVNLFVGIR